MSTETFLPGMARRIELWPVERLKPYENNARTHSPQQITTLAASIARLGFNAPILVDTDDGIVAGHGRLMAAMELGLTEVPVVVLDHLTDAQRRMYIIADNKLAELAGWDDDLLAQELESLRDEGMDLELTGFNEKELADLLDGAGWESDIAVVEKAGENTEGIEAKITIRCPQLDKDDVINTIQRAINESGIEGVRIDG